VNVPVYTTEILRLAASLHPTRELDRVDGQAELRSPTCGSTVATAVMLDDVGRIAALSQSVHACAFGQASAALLEQSAPGKSADEVARALEQLSAWLGGGREDPGDWPQLAALEPARRKTGRHGAILLPFRALLAALRRGA
jgi:NifU-like protein involved in Fe-S cluster formation